MLLLMTDQVTQQHQAEFIYCFFFSTVNASKLVRISYIMAHLIKNQYWETLVNNCEAHCLLDMTGRTFTNMATHLGTGAKCTTPADTSSLQLR